MPGRRMWSVRAEIVAQSGRRGAVTLSTNMAGRGTDILLGGNPDFMARLKLREMLDAGDSLTGVVCLPSCAVQRCMVT